MAIKEGGKGGGYHFASVVPPFVLLALNTGRPYVRELFLCHGRNSSDLAIIRVFFPLPSSPCKFHSYLSVFLYEGPGSGVADRAIVPSLVFFFPSNVFGMTDGIYSYLFDVC